VDGAAVIDSFEAGCAEPRPGTFIRGRVYARAGFDLEVKAAGVPD
jgi:hypothetical protein